MITSRERLNGNGHLTTDEGDLQKMSEFKYLGALITEHREVGKEVKHRLNSGNACFYSVQRSYHPEFSLETLNLEYINP